MLSLPSKKSLSPPSSRRLWRSLDVGLAFSERAAYLVAGQLLGGRYVVVGSGRLAFDTSISADPSGAVQATRKWLTEELGFCPGQVVATVPAVLMDYEAVDLGNLAPPDQAPEGHDYGRLATHALGQVLGAEAAHATHDFWVTHPPRPDSSASTTSGCQTSMLHLVWTAQTTAMTLGRGLAVGGRELRTLSTPLSALARCSSWNNPHAAVLLVDIEDTTVSLVWCQNEEPHYVRNQIQFATQSPAESLASRRGISIRTAQTTLTRWGLSPDSDLPPLCEVVSACLHDWLERLSFEIQRTIRYLSGQHGPTACQRIALCGPSAAISGLAPWLQAALGLPVATVTPPPSIEWKSAQPYDPGYAMALANAWEARWQ